MKVSPPKYTGLLYFMPCLYECVDELHPVKNHFTKGYVDRVLKEKLMIILKQR